MIMKVKMNKVMLGSLLVTLIVVLLAAYTMVGLSRFYNNSEKKEAAQIKKIIQSDAVQCYALEGAYPPDLAYLVKNYGLILNKKRYYYDYTIFASNVAPQIEVLPIGKERK